MSFFSISKHHLSAGSLIYSWFRNKARRRQPPPSLNSELLSINECLSTVKEATAADECSLGITASRRDGRENYNLYQALERNKGLF